MSAVALVDVEGVLVRGGVPLPTASETFNRLRSQMPVCLLSNTTSVSSSDLRAQLVGGGFNLDNAEVLTAGLATASYLRRAHPSEACLILNSGSLDDFSDVEQVNDATGAQVVVIGCGGDVFTWGALNECARALQMGAALVGMHGSSTWRGGEGLCLDAGAFLALLSGATGVSAKVVGKPSVAMFDAALELLRCAPEEAVMIGDDLQADIAPAIEIGMRAVVVLTGKTSSEDFDRSEFARHPRVRRANDLSDAIGGL